MFGEGFEIGASYPPLMPLPDLTDEDAAYNPPNISSVIRFASEGDARVMLDALGGTPDGRWEPVDFSRIVPLPENMEGLETVAKRAWGRAAWGVDHNAGGAEVIEEGRAVRFFTQDIPMPFLQALARKFPNMSWQYYAAGWQLQTHIEGRAQDGGFTMITHYPADADVSRRIEREVFGRS